MFPTLAVVAKFGHTLSDTVVSRRSLNVSDNERVGETKEKWGKNYNGNPEILRPWRENLIKQCDSTVMATPARAVHVNHATPSSAVHQAGQRRMHGREELCFCIYP